MFGLFEKTVSTIVSTATLPFAVAADLYNTINDENKESVTKKTMDNIVNNVSDIATGDWENKKNND